MKFIFFQNLKKNLKCRPYLEHKQVHCISARTRRFARNTIQYGLLLLLIVILALWIGALAQDNRAGQQEDTLYLYQSKNVCAMEIPDILQELIDTNSTENITVPTEELKPIVINTFNSSEEANEQDNVTIIHCQECGQCSNPKDIKIYDDTKETLFESSYVCSKRGLLSGRRATRRCLLEKVGLSEGCTDCWVENIMCDLKYCMLTCMLHAIFSEVNSDTDDQQSLNRCTECDEKRCGPAFVSCAGANRRRSGIESEFDRDLDREVCDAVDPGWWKEERLQDYWALQNKLGKSAASEDPVDDDDTRRRVRASKK
jgi:hypothetical protein